MNNKLMKTLKLGVLLFGVSVLVFNCEKDDNQHPTQNILDTSPNIQAEWLGVDELPNKVIQAISNSSQNKTAYNKQSFNSFKLTNNDSVVRTIDSLGFQKYSFKSNVSLGLNDFYFDNYIVTLDPNDNVATYTIRYSPNREWFLENGAESLINFTGNISYYKDDGSLFWEVELINGKVNPSISNKSSSSNNKTSLSSKQVTQEITVTIAYEDCDCHTTHASGGCTHPIMVIYISGSGGADIPYYSGGSGGEDDPSDPSFGGGGSSTPVNSMTVKETYIWYINNCASTNQSLESFLNTLSITQLRNLNNYLSANNCSTDAINFAALTLEAWDGDGVEDGEVDFEDGIIVTITNECQKDVLIEGLDNCSPLSSLVIDIFGGGYDIDYIIESNDLGPNTSASTSNIVKYNTITKKCFIKTTVDKNYLDTATDLSIARTIIHESFHATLTYMVVEGKFIYNGSPDSSFANVMNGYINYLETNNNDQYEGAQHEILLELVSEMATALKNYGVQNGYSLPSDFYSDLSWGGLTHLKDSSGAIIINPLFVNAVPNANDRTRIINTIATEVTNSNQGSLTPKGKPCD